MNSPATSCRGSMKLVPAKAHDAISWKIWIFSTWVENLDIHPENTVLLDSPGRELEDIDQFETEVFIIGGGNA